MTNSIRSIALVAATLAIAAISCASTDQDRNVTSSDRRAAAQFERGEYRESLASFIEAAHENELSYVPVVGIARCYAYLGDSVRFENAATQAGALAPRTVLAWQRLGVMYVQAAERFRQSPGSRQYAEIGIEMLRPVFAARPSDPDVIYTLGVAFTLAENDPSAILMLEQARKSPRHRVLATGLLLDVLKSLGNRKRALEILDEMAGEGSSPQAYATYRRWAQDENRGG